MIAILGGKMNSDENGTKNSSTLLTELVEVENRQSGRFNVKIGRVYFDGDNYINIELICSNDFIGQEHMPSRVFDMLGKNLWSFKDEKESGFDGRGRLVFFKKISELIIYLETREGITKIIPLMSLAKLSPVELNDSFLNLSGRTIAELAELKKGLARELGKKVILTQEEKDALEEAWLIRKANRKAEQDEEDRRRQEEYLKRKEEKQKKVKAILARSPITACTASGQILGGIPVVDTEWTILPGYTKVILVKNFYEETGLPGEPIEAFIVKKIGYEREKSHVKSLVYSQRPKIGKEVPKAAGSFIFKIENKYEKVFYFTTENARILKEQGVSKETKIAIGNPDANGKYCVVLLNEEGEEKVVGAFEPVNLKEYLRY